MTAQQYFYAAIKSIDDRFGDNYAENHPELVAAFLQTAAADYHTAILAQEIQTAASIVAEAINNRE